jgi:isoleucyl-tRNA synthetase
LLANIHDFDPKDHLVSKDDRLMIDNWVIAKAAALQEELKAAYDNYQMHLVTHRLQNFCTNELGSFYLDIIKDRQYTLQANAVARRSCQSAMYLIVKALARWLAPILSFTAEEIWDHLPGEKTASVFISLWPTFNDELVDTPPLSLEDWSRVSAVRDAVNKALEASRKAGLLGSALEAHVTLWGSDTLLNQLSIFGDELKFVLITSGATLKPMAEKDDMATPSEIEGLCLSVTALEDAKCERCWHRSATVDAASEYPGVCQRCVENLSTESGEQRQFA